jgi:hypothetical protein
MAFGIDEILESALGPWGLAIGLGVGAIVSRREKLLPALASGAEASRGRIGALSTVGAERARVGKARLEAVSSAGTEKARAGLRKIAPAAAGLGGGMATVGSLAARARSLNVARTGQAMITDFSRSWGELYAEARADFEASHPNKKNAVWVNGERVDDIIQPRAHAQRDSRGRFIKRAES